MRTLSLAFFLLCLTTAAPAAQTSSESEWEYILAVTRRYYQSNHSNPSAAVFANQLYEITRISYRNRSEAGGWAGDFVRGNLYFSARDIEQRYAFWTGRVPAVDAIAQTVWRNCSLDLLGSFDPDNLLGSLLTGLDYSYVCNGVARGAQHFRYHLEPFFEAYIRRYTARAIASAPGTNRIPYITASLNAFCYEHNSFLDNAVGPGFRRVLDIPGLGQWFARHTIPIFAADIRNSAILASFDQAKRSGLLTESQVDVIIEHLDC